MAEENNGSPAEGSEGGAAAATEQPQERQFNDVEKLAMSQGWVPQDQYQGTSKWRDAEEFLDRGELFSKIEEQKRYNRVMENTIQDLKGHMKSIRETEYRRALNALKASKREALDVGDNEKVVEIDDQIERTKQEAAKSLRAMDTPPASQQQAVADPTFQVWTNRNPWYSQSKAMQVFADATGNELALAGMRDPVQILMEVERRVKKEFPERFTNPKRDSASAVEAGGARGKSTDSFKLTDEETRVMNRFVKAGVLTKEQYIKDIKEQRGVE